MCTSCRRSWADALGPAVDGGTTAGQDAGVDFGLQCFYPAVEHLGEAGVVRHFGHRYALAGEQFCGATGGQDFHAQPVQSLCEFEYAGFVRHADECLFDGCHDGSNEE